MLKKRNSNSSLINNNNNNNREKDDQIGSEVDVAQSPSGGLSRKTLQTIERMSQVSTNQSRSSSLSSSRRMSSSDNNLESSSSNNTSSNNSPQEEGSSSSLKLKKPSTPSRKSSYNSASGTNDKLNTFMKYLEDVDKQSVVSYTSELSQSSQQTKTMAVPPSPSHSYISTNSSASKTLNLNNSMDFDDASPQNSNPTGRLFSKILNASFNYLVLN